MRCSFYSFSTHFVEKSGLQVVKTKRNAAFERLAALLGWETARSSIITKDSTILSEGGEESILSENDAYIRLDALVELINFPPSPIPKVKTGILRKVGGSMETYMTPGLAAADAIPRHIVANPAGYAFHQNGLAYTNLVMTGPWLATATAGLASLTAGAVVNITAGAAMNITATAAVNIKGLTIFLN